MIGDDNVGKVGRTCDNVHYHQGIPVLTPHADLPSHNAHRKRISARVYTHSVCRPRGFCLKLASNASFFALTDSPFSFDNYAMRTVADSGEPVVLSLFDTASPEEDWFLKCRIWRDLYSRADVFLVCFSIVSPSSFENVKCKVRGRAHAPYHL